MAHLAHGALDADELCGEAPERAPLVMSLVCCLRAITALRPTFDVADKWDVTANGGPDIDLLIAEAAGGCVEGLRGSGRTALVYLCRALTYI
jgi:hypothetical protein